MTTEGIGQRRLILENAGIEHGLPLHGVLEWRDAFRPLVLAVHQRGALRVGQGLIADFRAPGRLRTAARFEASYSVDYLHEVRIPGRQPARQAELLLTVAPD